MKKAVASVAMLLALAVSVPANADDACETVLCMFGKLTGNDGGSQCSGPIKDYFSIIKKKHGDIRWGKTSNARLSFLQECKSGDPGIIKQINNKYGKVKG